MLEGLLRMHLAPIHEALAELHDAAEENRRQGNNLIAKGVVESVVEGRRIVVAIGENKNASDSVFLCRQRETLLTTDALPQEKLP